MEKVVNAFLRFINKKNVKFYFFISFTFIDILFISY